MKKFTEGDEVKWEWGAGQGKGKVVKKFISDVSKTIKGSEVKRNASEEEPAYLIEQEDGDEVLKSGLELTKG